MKHLRQDHGYAMLLVIFTTLLITVISLGLITMNVNSVKTSKHEEVNQAVFYIAEAGLNYEKEQINELITNAYFKTGIEHENNVASKIFRNDDYYKSFYKNKIIDDIGKRYTSTEIPPTIQPKVFDRFELQNSDKPFAEIIATVEGIEPLTINIESTGFFAERKSNKRTVSQSIEVIVDLKFLYGEADPPTGNINLPNLAVQAKGDISLKGGATIDGSVSSSNGKVIFNGNDGVNITGVVGVAPDNFIKGAWSLNGNKIIAENRVKSTKVTEYSLPEFPTEIMEALKNVNYPSDFILNKGAFTADWNSKSNYVLKENAKFKDFIIPDGRRIKIDIGNSQINLLVENDFSLGSSGNIEIIGSGTLNIYVKNKMTIRGMLSTSDKNPENINIYYAGSSTPAINNNSQPIAASLYIQSSNFELNNGMSISGNIISGGTHISVGGSSGTTGKYILAPNAHLEHIDGELKGVIIVNSYSSSGGSKVTYAPGLLPLPNVKEPPDYNSLPNLIIEQNLVEI